MKKNYYKIICAICAICGFTSCADFLEIKPQDEIILEDFWNEKADVDAVVAGCYAGLQSDAVIRRMLMWGEFRSENFMASGTNVEGDVMNVFKENITAKNSYTKYDAFYTVINRCNTVIKYAPDVAAHDPGYTQSELKATIAEVSAIRDLCYFYLIRTFRNVPYVTEAVTDDDQTEEIEKPATDFYTILDALIADLLSVRGDAIVRYPESSPAYQTGRITRDAIDAMLCEMYLWKKDYNQCIYYADQVIASKKQIAEEKKKKATVSSATTAWESRLDGYPLVLNSRSSNAFGIAFNKIFAKEFLSSSTEADETIFELVYDNTAAGNGMPANGCFNAWFGNRTDKGQVLANEVVVDESKKESARDIFANETKWTDSRLYINFEEDGTVVKGQYENVSLSLSGAKVTATYSNQYTKDHNSSNWIVYRLPDIMLMKAEALVELMGESVDETMRSECFILVNAINKRWLCQNSLTADTLKKENYTSQSQMRKLVMDERHRELMFEGKRWYDLVRLSMRFQNMGANNIGWLDFLSTAVNRRTGPNGSLAKSFFKKSFEGNDTYTQNMWSLFWPYHYDEITVNPYLVQNPAFGSGMSDSYK